MLNIIPFIESNNNNLFDSTHLSGFIFENVLDLKLYNLLQAHINNLVSLQTKDTFLTHGTVFNVNDKKIKIKDNSVDREQNVIFDITFDIDYYYQTKHSIKSWSENKIKELVSPIFLKTFNKLQTLPPLNLSSDWILYRGHINYLPTDRLFTLHIDGNPSLLNTYNSKLARIISLTFYLHDHIEGMGGEFWSINGFVYKPKQNSALLLNNGNCVLHGVTENKNARPRLAFTLRFMHRDDMMLTGHPDKFLYNLDNLKLHDH